MLLIFWISFGGKGGGREMCDVFFSDEGFSFFCSFGGFFSSECLPKSVLCRVCCAEINYS